MQATLEGRGVAKAKGRPPKSDEGQGTAYGPAKLSKEAIRVGKSAASLKGMTLADFASEAVIEAAKRVIAGEAAK